LDDVAVVLSPFAGGVWNVWNKIVGVSKWRKMLSELATVLMQCGQQRRVF
jgi:hypothetical protein